MRDDPTLANFAGMKGPISILSCAAILAATLTAGCGIPEEQYNRDVNKLKGELSSMTASRDDLKTRLEKLRGDYATCTGERDTCGRELAAMRSKGQKLDAGLQRALDRIAELERIAARQRAIFDKLRNSLADLERAGKLKIAIVRGQFVVQLADAILFDPGSSRLKTVGAETIREVTQILALDKKKLWQVAGHTDAEGGAAYNWGLSSSRAWSVARFMIRSGMAPTHISFAGYGEFQPVGNNEDANGRKQNRRIEIMLVPNMEEVLGPLLGGAKG